MSINALLKNADVLPEHQRAVLVFTKSMRILSPVEYCHSCNEWHSLKGDLRQEKIHKWVYMDDALKAFEVSEADVQSNTKREELTEEDKEALFSKLGLLAFLAVALSDEKPKHFH